MTTYFITRHPGAIAWARQQGLNVDQQLTHLDITHIQAGDTVIGSLPVYIHLSLTVPEHWRGQELTVEQMTQCQAQLEQYSLKKLWAEHSTDWQTI